MLETIVRFDENFDIDRDVAAPPSRLPIIASAAPAARYGAQRRIHIPGALLVGLLHIVLIVLIIQARTVYVHKQEAALAVVNLMPPAPPPPSQETPPPPSAPEIVAPTPLIQTPAPPLQTIAVAPEPSPRPVPAIAPAPPAPPALPPAPPSTIQSTDLATRMIAGKPPRYPMESRRKHEQGTVVLSITLGTDGRVAFVAISQSSGFARLDDAASTAVRGWRWEPTLRGGQPVQVRGLVEIPFVLQG